MNRFYTIKRSFYLITITMLTTMYACEVFASIEGEKKVEALFKKYDKHNVAKIILEKRHGKITIQKHMSFVDSFGKPDLSFITAKSVEYDLGLLGIGFNELSTALLEQDKKQAMEKKKKDVVVPATPEKEPVPLSAELAYKIKVTKKRIKDSKSESDKRRLRKELATLRYAYKRAKRDERKQLKIDYRAKQKKKSYDYRSDNCRRAKDELQKHSSSVSRHQVFFCGEHQYRKQNPKSCGNREYGTQYGLKEYRKKVTRLRNEVSKWCRT